MSLFMWLFGKTLSKADLLEVREINRLVAAEQFKLASFKGNTALLVNGRKCVDELEAQVKLLTSVRDSIANEKAKALGFPEGLPFSINLENGQITQ